MNKPNRKAVEIDIMDMKLVPLSEVAEGFCRHRKNNGEPCKRRAVVMGVCPSHLQSIGGHIFVTDNKDPEFPGWEQKENFSYCRACGQLESGHTLELCPVRSVNPAASYPPSPLLPNRLLYQFAKPERTTIAMRGKQINATCCGPFAAYRIKPDTGGLTWEVFHLPSRRRVAHLDSEAASIKTMRKICHRGVDLDFADPMRMNHDSRFYISLANEDGERGKPAHMPGGILAWSAAKPYYRTRKETDFHWMKEGEKIECWGPFGFAIKDSEVLLQNLDEPSYGTLFWLPSREQAIAFSKAATALNLNWRRSYSKDGYYYEPETIRGIEKLISDFQGIICWRTGLLPQPPPEPPRELPLVAGMTSTEISIATDQGPRKIPAYVVAEYFAVHCPLDPQQKGYVLSHKPSGYQMGISNDISSCLEAMPELVALGNWNFARPRDISSELLAQAQKAQDVLSRHGVMPTCHSITLTVRIM
jgi:hypothetical protein